MDVAAFLAYPAIRLGMSVASMIPIFHQPCISRFVVLLHKQLSLVKLLFALSMVCSVVSIWFLVCNMLSCLCRVGGVMGGGGHSSGGGGLSGLF